MESLKSNVGAIKSPAVTTGWPGTDTAASGSSDGGKTLEQILRDKIQEVTKLKAENMVKNIARIKIDVQELGTNLKHAEERIKQLEVQVEDKEKAINEATEIKYGLVIIFKLLDVAWNLLRACQVRVKNALLV